MFRISEVNISDHFSDISDMLLRFALLELGSATLSPALNTMTLFIIVVLSRFYNQPCVTEISMKNIPALKRGWAVYKRD